jgi:hypothetical protein
LVEISLKPQTKTSTLQVQAPVLDRTPTPSRAQPLTECEIFMQTLLAFEVEKSALRIRAGIGALVWRFSHASEIYFDFLPPSPHVKPRWTESKVSVSTRPLLFWCLFDVLGQWLRGQSSTCHPFWLLEQRRRQKKSISRSRSSETDAGVGEAHNNRLNLY